MLTLYKKVEKSKECPSGYLELKDDVSDKPFLMCISAQDNHDKSIYGTIREGVKAARVYTTIDEGAGYKVDEFPVQFLGVRFRIDEDYQSVADELVDKFIYPYLISHGTDLNNLVQCARKMNFMTYCDGTLTYSNIEKALKDKLTLLSLSNDDIKKIISNMHLVAVGTMVDTSSLDTTSISLIDINDDEILTEDSYKLRSRMQEKNMSNLLYGSGSNSSLYYYMGSGEHSLKEYSTSGVYIKPYFHFVISRVLDASINGRKYNLDDMLSELQMFSSKKKTESDSLEFIDKLATFNKSPKYSKGEIVLRRELDELYKQFIREKREKEGLERDALRRRDTQEIIIGNIKKYSSDVGFYQILCDIGLWQAPIGMDPYELPSDREIRAMSEENNNKFHM